MLVHVRCAVPVVMRLSMSEEIIKANTSQLIPLKEVIKGSNELNVGEFSVFVPNWKI